MTDLLPPNQLESLLPALRHVAELVQKSGAPSREDLQLLLIASGLDEDWAIDELQRWAKLLAAVRNVADTGKRDIAQRALMLRGIPEAPAKLAVETTSASAPTPPSKPTTLPIQLSSEAIGFGELKPGQEAQAMLTVSGGPGRVNVGSDMVTVQPEIFGPDETTLTVTVKGGVDGQVLWDALTLESDTESVKVDLTARWAPQPIVETSEKSSSQSRRFEELDEGLSIEEALEAFMDGCNKRDRLFAPQRWVNPRLSDLRKLLSDPITAEQAAALREAALKKRNLDTVIDWLRHRPMTWQQYQDMLAERRAEEEQRLAQERKREEQERGALRRDFARVAAKLLTRLIMSSERLFRRDFARVAAKPLSHVTGGDVLDAFYDAWARCEFPPGYHLPASGMGDMVLESIRDSFASHFIAGLQALLPGNRDAQNLSGRAQLSDTFDRIWASLPKNERRSIAMRIWREYLLPNTCTKWDIEPGDAENLLNLKEFMRVRQLPDSEKWRYVWLAEAR